MSIAIESGFAIPATRRTNPNKITPGLKTLMDRYSVAYKACYGVPPTIVWQNPWFKITGLDARVSRSRLLELTRQLEYRSGT